MLVEQHANPKVKGYPAGKSHHQERRCHCIHCCTAWLYVEALHCFGRCGHSVLRVARRVARCRRRSSLKVGPGRNRGCRLRTCVAGSNWTRCLFKRRSHSERAGSSRLLSYCTCMTYGRAGRARRINSPCLRCCATLCRRRAPTIEGRRSKIYLRSCHFIQCVECYVVGI